MSWSSGTNTIKEGDESKSLTCQMFEVRKQGGGTEYLVRKSDVTLGTKSVTQNGTYTAAADGKYGFSQFSVNVRGGNGSADSHGKPTGGDIKPGGAGSAVTGTDPETGEEVVVGVDEDGNIVQTPIPYGIKIVTPPTKTDYVYQETMDYSGIGVKLTNKNGDTYTDVDHPSGWYVNPEDLIFPVEKAPAASGGGDGSTASLSDYAFTRYTVTSDGSSVIPVRRDDDISAVIGYTVMPYGGTGVPSGTPIYCAIFDRALVFLCNNVTSTNNQIILKRVYQDGRFSSGSITTLSQIPSSDGVFYADYTPSGNKYYTSSVIPKHEIEFRDVLKQLQPGAGIDDSSGTATIPVKWANPYTGATHQDTFEITSTPANGDAHTSTGSSGTEGSGGGGSF